MEHAVGMHTYVGDKLCASTEAKGVAKDDTTLGSYLLVGVPYVWL